MAHAGFETIGRGGKDGAGGEAATPRRLYGIVELDPSGLVLYSRFEPDGPEAPAAAADVTGLNFYTEVAPFRNVGEFRRRLDDFSRGSQPAQTLDFTCDYADGPVQVRLVLARIRERAEMEATKSILVHIRRAS